MSFRLKLSSEAIARLEAEANIAAGYHAMTDAFLAHSLLRAARTARREAPAELANPAERNYDTTLVWHVIPVLASRLGPVTLLPNEGTDRDVAGLDDRKLRTLVGQCLRNSGLGSLGRKHRPNGTCPCALDVLGREFVNGNPIAMAADRVSPPDLSDDSREDWLAVHMREVGRSRFGHEEFLAWEPAFQDWKNASIAEPEADATPSFSI